jgi:hypothetical protein
LTVATSHLLGVGQIQVTQQLFFQRIESIARPIRCSRRRGGRKIYPQLEGLFVIGRYSLTRDGETGRRRHIVKIFAVDWEGYDAKFAIRIQVKGSIWMEI